MNQAPNREIYEKLTFVEPNQIKPGNYSLFGTGKYASYLFDILDGQYGVQINYIVEYDRYVHSKKINYFKGKKIIPLSSNSNDIILGASNLQFQHNQLYAISSQKLTDINVFYVDTTYKLRKHNVKSAKKNVYILDSCNMPGSRPWEIIINNVVPYLKTKRCNVEIESPLNIDKIKNISPETPVLIYNGQASPLIPIKKHLKQIGAYPTFIELGLFPQNHFFYFDKKGVNQESALMDDDLEWVESKHFEKLDEVRKNFLGSFSHKSKDYILVPLQIATDTNVINSSRFQSGMQEFIDYIFNFYKNNEKIVFKAHPKDVNKNLYDYRGHESSELPFIKLLERAKLVHGITSTTLYEAALAGVEVISEGVSLLNRHQNQPQKLLAAMVDRQIPISETNLDYWVGRYSNLHL